MKKKWLKKNNSSGNNNHKTNVNVSMYFQKHFFRKKQQLNSSLNALCNFHIKLSASTKLSHRIRITNHFKLRCQVLTISANLRPAIE